MGDREYVAVARGRGRRWVAAASERGRAWILERTPTRVRVAYLTGTGRERSIWLPKDAVTSLMDFRVSIGDRPAPEGLARVIREELVKIQRRGGTGL
jgi:hypothetical protein